MPCDTFRSTLQKSYFVTVRRCEESGMFIGRSEDFFGLVVEAETRRAIVDAIIEVAPDLLMANEGLSPEDVGKCLINIEIPITNRRLER